ncbi:MAG: hypothetical protein J6Q51_03080 [Clostridia bacterium]|nr:hypothetical protein [Clostridia bacterium]
MKFIKHVEGLTYNRETKDTIEYYKDEFLKRRAVISRKTYNKGSLDIEDIYAEAYHEQCELAASGDVIAEDLLAYWFKHGNPCLPENVETSYKWLFLAGAGGNKHSLNKLTLFFNYAYDTICYSDYYADLIELMELTAGNFQILLGEVVCQHLVEELGINAMDLAQLLPVEVKFNQQSMQRLTAALNRVLPKVDDYFRKLIAKSKK